MNYDWSVTLQILLAGSYLSIKQKLFLYNLYIFEIKLNNSWAVFNDLNALQYLKNLIITVLFQTLIMFLFLIIWVNFNSILNVC